MEEVLSKQNWLWGLLESVVLLVFEFNASIFRGRMSFALCCKNETGDACACDQQMSGQLINFSVSEIIIYLHVRM